MFSGAQHVNGLIAAGSFGGTSVKLNVDEVGIIGGSYCPVDTLFSSDKSYWNVAASLWGYYYGELARLGSTAIAASQLTGYPADTWEGIVMPGGRPVDNNFPCVSMMDWRGNGRQNILFLMLLHFACCKIILMFYFNSLFFLLVLFSQQYKNWDEMAYRKDLQDLVQSYLVRSL